jgi:nucleotidyltransferase/DNA polymerase involved in DNA repair
LHRANSRKPRPCADKPIIVLQTLTDSACAIAASYPAKRLGITTGTGVR